MPVLNPLARLMGRAAALGVAGSAAAYGVNQLRSSYRNNPAAVNNTMNSFTTVIPPDYADSLRVMETLKTGLPDTVVFLTSDDKGNVLAIDNSTGEAFTYDINNSRILERLKMNSDSKRRFGRFLKQRESVISKALPDFRKESEDDRAVAEYLEMIRRLNPGQYVDDVRPDAVVGSFIEAVGDDEAARLRRAYRLAIGLGGLALFGAGATAKGSGMLKFDKARYREIMGRMKEVASRTGGSIRNRVTEKLNTPVKDLLK